MSITHLQQQAILSSLEQHYQGATTALEFGTPFELLVATVLAAQCTDKQVNKITAKLFPKYNTPEQFAYLTPEQLAEEIKGCGLYISKSKNIVALAQQIMVLHGGSVPDTLEDLEALPGVGRKTANVVLSVAFGKPAFAVDTHVFRVSNRMGLAKAKNPLETERQVCDLMPSDKWADAHHWLIHHGRAVCKARNPLCHECPVQEYCPRIDVVNPVPSP